MTIILPAFTPAQESLWLTQCGRALDSRLPEPFLGDTMADQVVTEVGYDLASFPLPRSKIFDIAMRAKRLDSVVRDFIAAHPDAVVLDLGAGLDSRVFRIDPPDTVDWYDIDFPEVTAIRRQVLPQRPGVHPVGADLNAADWLDHVPNDRPTVIVADGLVPFLSQDGLVTLLNRLVAHAPSGELALNGYPKFVVWIVKHYPRMFGSIAAGVVNPGFDDPHDLERWAPGLTLIEESFPSRGPELARLSRSLRLLAGVMERILAGSPSWSRRLNTTVLHYRF